MSKYIDLNEATDLFKGIDATMTGGWVADTLEALPTIEVSEDCISKAYLEQEIENLCRTVDKDKEYWRGWNNALDKVVELIDNAPSVAPSRAEGEWIMHVDDFESTQECSVCHSQHLICGNDDNYCPYCGAYMKG